MEELETKRKELGLSMAKFSALIGVPLSTYEKWQMGIRKCPDYVIRLIIFFLEHQEE